MPKKKNIRSRPKIVVETLESRTFLSATPSTLSVATAATPDLSFGKSILAGATSSSPTSLQFGPDGKLYVAQQDGIVKIYTIARSSANHYAVTATQTITSIESIPNHNDDGTLAPSVTGRLVTGLLITGTAKNPVIYVTSSDPRIGGGANGVQTHLDTNSGIISRLTWNGSSWVKLDLVRGLPRSQENHATNGMALDPQTNTLYVAQGGNTNMGAPSHNFDYEPEYALSAAILSVNLNAIGSTTYDLPTLDDQSRAGVHDANDPFGGDLGNNQAILAPGGPVQIYSPGYRNPYDIVLTTSGNLYTIDNGSNANWGDVPIGAGGSATNQVHEPGVTYPDQLQLVTPNFYGGHPDPTRANRANTFDPKNPQSPVSVADPRQGDYLVPGVQDGALTTFSNSTNGITQYTASTFSGAMKGDLLAASLDNTVYLIGLNSAGTAIASKQALFKNVGSAPLDVTTQGDSGAFPGTIWVADIATGQIVAFEPGASSGATAVDDPNLDDDGDGYSNHDELLNRTDPKSSADAPADNDHDLVSNLLDNDDDNDGLPDTSDPFAIDAHNGRTTNLPVMLEFGRDGLGGGGLLNMGFTGLMTNAVSDYSTLYDPNTLTAGGAAGVFTIDQVASGDALGSRNNQQQAFQVGFNATTASSDFTVHTRLLAPFFGASPQVGQSMGFYLGTGDQNNYLKFVLSGDNGGELELLKETAGATSIGAETKVSLSGVTEISLYVQVDPSSGSVQPQFTVTRNGAVSALQNLGASMTVPRAWFSSASMAPAAGIIATRGSAPTFAATWGCLEITSAPAKNLTASAPSVDFGAPRLGVATPRTLTLKNAGASGQGPITINSITLQGADAASFATSFKAPVTLLAGQSYSLTITCKSTHAGNLAANLIINQTGANGALTIPLSASSTSKAFVSITPTQPLGIDASTWESKSFSVTNKSLDGQMISSITIDLRGSLLPDLLFTPTTAGGDDVPKDITADSDPTVVGLSTHSYAAPLDGGYQLLQVNFTNFGPGKTFLFSLDIDPASIKGAHSPGPSGSGGISGLELSGSKWAFGFSDGSAQSGQIYRTPSSVSGGQNVFEASADVAPVIEMLGVASTQTNLTHAAHTVRINGIPGQHVQLLVAEGGLYTSGVPGGGYDLQSNEDNRIVKLWETSATIGAGGYVNVPITLTKTDANSGYNHIIAVVKDADGHTGPISNALLAYYTPVAAPPEANVLSLTLINADTGQAIQTITNGSTIDLAKLPSRRLNVRADVTAATASVDFGFDSNANYRIESVAPFALFADDHNGHYYAGSLSVGSHTITATAYAATKAAGTAGGVLKISFTVVDSAA
jgi:hypothetical protein